MKCNWSVTSTYVKCPQPVNINDLVVNLEDAQTILINKCIFVGT